MIYNDIADLTAYGTKKELIGENDVIYTVNLLLDALGLESYEEQKPDRNRELSSILNSICDYAAEKGLIPENTTTYRDLFDTKIMGIMTPRPTEVIEKFNSLYKLSPKQATDFYYDFCGNTNYIRRDRIARDMKWKADTEYGKLIITINLSKPEKDPRAIALAKTMKQSGYPKCQLCAENEGYAGRINHPARQNHRIIPIRIDGNEWGFQYSPYVYYNEHCIVLNKKHIPMIIDRKVFEKLFDFVKQFPHYFVGSNADLPIVGGSILSHEHFQGGNFSFPMAQAVVEESFTFSGFDDVEAGIVKWPMSVIRLSSENIERLVNLGERILNKWRCYSDPDAFIYAETDGEAHNTITPIARKAGSKYQLDLVLRNNITTDEHPLGVYHPHSNLHHIKKENIGLIEVMGMAILPARLKTEIKELEDALVDGREIRENEVLEKHAEWVDELRAQYVEFTAENVHGIIEKEIGKVFMNVLEDAGVYKRNAEGKESFRRFIKTV